MAFWITSDLHFGHTNIMKFCPDTRQHDSVQDMNEYIVQEWNRKVQPDDTTYILGDVAFCHHDVAIGFMNRLNGKKILIEGNHDSKLLKMESFRDCFSEIHKYHEIKINGTTVVMFHYPITEWNRMHHGSVHLYGHLHNSLSGLEKYRARNVGMDTTGEVVVKLEDIVNDALTGDIKSHHQTGD